MNHYYYHWQFINSLICKVFILMTFLFYDIIYRNIPNMSSLKRKLGSNSSGINTVQIKSYKYKRNGWQNDISYDFWCVAISLCREGGGGGQDKNTDKNTNWANLDELMRKNPLKLAILNFHRPNLYVYLHYTHSRKTFINSFLCF